MVAKIPSEDISAKVHVLMTTDNIPALETMACNVDYISKDGCCICHVVGQSPGHDQYFQMASTITMRASESFKSKYFWAVDWVNFILFVISTLVVEHVCSQVAHKALHDLIQTGNLLISWELSVEKKTLIKT
ncbi:hypothetical protein PHYBLDRAFT_72689 [Phycomyces blakesleeanus NRRL 1555(-)]|uniref:Uncharacterized protein n=1 Tax=Phycomyces blakesleeanus (strain ATCC 8743b / DSM 1359 / FGSC 10004 / NBRC 33097 / NRRL 1555) TaxID=763407 RepID=A0A162TXK8_PHYB8|nr:hypothetical protein PHYBLDRAFT_72689 [Phycomyces blakesleeanus NRRL 1555(-)]OAD71812.1 hypothetical protein PHYBLDRAFT_72689 [Phycomyces blakesleeanus NRRL 1555(-)]|eukprot:XP_018289852.1 hypothetical protein PHYBLDRAFT_72689 [Phycomyces blakesleeanus NRRL 1555(-)]